VTFDLKQDPLLLRRVVLRNNRLLEQSNFGIAVLGYVQDLQIVGNLICGPITHGAIQFQHLKEPRELLVANNTLFNCDPAAAIRLWDREAASGVEVSANLILGSAEPDFVFIDSGGDALVAKGPGDGKLLLEKWRVRGNWRETPLPIGNALKALAWIPPGPTDQRLDRIDVLSRDPDHADFARPAADSPLATGGAGGELPVYVGVVAPKGVTAWDWNVTWQKRFPRDEKGTQP
jgi:hypothetical protein